MVKRMTGYKEKACHCGDDSNRLSHLSCGEPPVALSSGPSFPSEGSPQPIPIPLSTAVVAGPVVGLSPLSPSDSDNTGGKGVITQWVHGEFIVSFEIIHLVNTHQVCVEYF